MAASRGKPRQNLEICDWRLYYCNIKSEISPDKFVFYDFFSVVVANVHMTDHQISVEHHHQGDDPVDDDEVAPVEVNEDAKTVAEHSDRVSEEKDSNDGQIGEAVKNNHDVNQLVSLQ